MSFICDLDFLGGGNPSEEADQKHLQRLIDIMLLIEAHSQEETKAIFGKFQKL